MATNSSYLIISDTAMVETTVNKSRFIGVTFPVENMEEIRSLIATLKRSNKDAKHIAYAYILGADSSIAKSNDDGEPAGSAGAPIYQAIREKKLTNVLVAVVRYYGGVQLGKSRLTRVYYSAAANAIANSRKSKMIYCGIYDIRVPYSDVAGISKLLSEKGAAIIEKNFDDSMPIIKCAIPDEICNKLTEDIRSRVKEGVQMIRTSSEYYKFLL